MAWLATALGFAFLLLVVEKLEEGRSEVQGSVSRIDSKPAPTFAQWGTITPLLRRMLRGSFWSQQILSVARDPGGAWV
jgi:hypothetical protein